MENKTTKLGYTIWYYITLANGSLSIFNETLSKGEDSVSEALEKFNNIKEPKEHSWSWEHALSMMIELVEEDEELNARRIAIKTIKKENPLTVCYHAMSDYGLCEMFSTKEQAITRARNYMFENPYEYVYVTEQFGDEEEKIIWSNVDDDYECYLYVLDEKTKKYKWCGNYYSYEDAYNEAESSTYRHYKIEDEDGNFLYNK